MSKIHKALSACIYSSSYLSHLALLLNFSEPQGSCSVERGALTELFLHLADFSQCVYVKAKAREHLWHLFCFHKKRSSFTWELLTSSVGFEAKEE